MANTKMTKKEIYAAMMKVDGIKNNEVFTEFIEKQIAQLEKKSDSKNGKPSKQTVENDRIKGIIFNIVSNAIEPMSVSDIQNADPELMEMSSQRVISLISRQVWDAEKNPEGRLIKTYVKKKPFYEVRKEADTEE